MTSEQIDWRDIQPPARAFPTNALRATHSTVTHCDSIRNKLRFDLERCGVFVDEDGKVFELIDGVWRPLDATVLSEC